MVEEQLNASLDADKANGSLPEEGSDEELAMKNWRELPVGLLY